MRTAIIIILGIACGLLINAAIVGVLCWGLNAIGIYNIFGWNVVFSWPLVIVFTILVMIFKGTFKN